MLLLPTFRLPTLIHTRSANAKWLYELSHRNPVWMHPQDAKRIGVDTNDLVRVTTEIGYFVDRVILKNESGHGIGGIPYTLHDMQVEKLTVIRSGEIS